MIFGKLIPAGLLTDIGNRTAQTWADGSTDVPLVAIPSGFGPWTYDAVNQVAVSAARMSRTLLAIYNDLTALTTQQKANIWSDLTSGSPAKISADVGKNADSIFLLWRLANNVSLPAAVVTDMKLTAAAYYVQDQPKYLVHPSFDSTINVPGDQAA